MKRRVSSQNLSPKTKVSRWLKYNDLENKHSMSLLPNQQNKVLHREQDEILDCQQNEIEVNEVQPKKVQLTR